MQSTSEINFTQQQDTGLLILSGIIDIFEAEHLHDMARQAVENSGVQTLRLDMSAVERLDISAAQILIALKSGVEESAHKENARTFRVQAVSPSVAQALTTLGVKL